MLLTSRSASVFVLPVLTLVLAACGGGSRNAATPHGEATLTSAQVDGPRLEKLLVTDHGTIAIVDREGCMAMVREVSTPQGPVDEMQTRCAKPDRMDKWFEGAERVAAKMSIDPLALHERPKEIVDPKGPATAKVLDANGKVSKVLKPADITKLNAEVRALADELAGAEKVAPGPASASGWQMLHVSGPARVMFAGTPARGTLEARVSTNGQYLCEFTSMIDGESPMRATKSGWLKPANAARAIDVVLGPWSAQDAGTEKRSAYAAGMKGGTEHRSNAAATAAVFELFSQVQDALGDACLPELEAPSNAVIGF